MKRGAAKSRTPMLDQYRATRVSRPDAPQIRRWILRGQKLIVYNSAAAPEAKVDVLVPESPPTS